MYGQMGLCLYNKTALRPLTGRSSGERTLWTVHVYCPWLHLELCGYCENLQHHHHQVKAETLAECKSLLKPCNASAATLKAARSLTVGIQTAKSTYAQKIQKHVKSQSMEYLEEHQMHLSLQEEYCTVACRPRGFRHLECPRHRYDPSQSS